MMDELLHASIRGRERERERDGVACRGCHRPRHERSRMLQRREREKKRSARKEIRKGGREREAANGRHVVQNVGELVCVPCSECTEQALLVRGHLSYDRCVPTLLARLPTSSFFLLFLLLLLLLRFFFSPFLHFHSGHLDSRNRLASSSRS